MCATTIRGPDVGDVGVGVGEALGSIFKGVVDVEIGEVDPEALANALIKIFEAIKSGELDIKIYLAATDETVEELRGILESIGVKLVEVEEMRNRSYVLIEEVDGEIAIRAVNEKGRPVELGGLEEIRISTQELVEALKAEIGKILKGRARRMYGVTVYIYKAGRREKTAREGVAVAAAGQPKPPPGGEGGDEDREESEIEEVFRRLARLREPRKAREEAG